MALTKAVGRVTPTFSPTQTGTSDSSSVPIPTKVTLNSSVTKPTTAAPIRISQVRYRTMGGRALCIRDVMNSLLSTADKLQRQTVLPRRSGSGFAKAVRLNVGRKRERRMAAAIPRSEIPLTFASTTRYLSECYSINPSRSTSPSRPCPILVAAPWSSV
ncbi:hypothetical protein D3C72_1005610 [compost metagenome]